MQSTNLLNIAAGGRSWPRPPVHAVEQLDVPALDVTEKRVAAARMRRGNREPDQSGADRTQPAILS